MIATHVPAAGSGGGMVRYAVEVAKELNRRDDVELHVLGSSGTSGFWADLLGDPVRAHTAVGAPGPSLAVLERAGRAASILREPMDVVHGTKHLLPRRARGATLLTVHDMMPLDRPGDFGAAKRWFLPKPYLDSIRSADRLVCVSEATLARTASYVPSAVARATVVPLATAPGLVGAAPAPVDALVGRRFALVVGDPSPRKDVPLVVGAWQRIAAEVPDALLALVGPPSWGPTAYGQQVAALEARGSLVRLGHIPDDQLRWCYENAAVVACPALLEGFGLPAAEALAFGRPLLISEDPALAEASRGQARTIYSGDMAAWSAALLDAVQHPAPSAPTDAVPRSWADVAAETVDAVRGVGHG
jgi:glycosyltransferase involved in cell wall biosynthesis